MRPSLDDWRMGFARMAALRSLCVVSRVGAVFFDRDGRLVGQGYNGPPRGFDTGGLPCSEWCERRITGDRRPDYGNEPSVHAELNAATHANRSELVGATLYVTRAPCEFCRTVVANLGLARVVWLSPDPLDDRMVDLSTGTRGFLEKCNIRVDVIDAARIAL